jgi:GNAT superfamily N-acetyltransferase
MTDMLVKLYEIPDDWSFLAQQAALGITIRKPLGPENHLVVAWVREKFEEAWASEVDAALSNRPVSCFIALHLGELAGFSCYDATALGFFGPGGVGESFRGRGTGKALLRACLLDMKLKGYGYAIIGDAGPQEFYTKAAGAVAIPASTPGIYKGLLRYSE